VCAIKPPHKKTSEVGHNKKKIYIKVSNGLANRLRALNSFYSFAKNNNRELYVCWDSGPGWSDEKFSDLFEDIESLKFIDAAEYDSQTKNIFQIDKHVYKNENNPDQYTIDMSTKDILDIINKENFSYCGDSCLEYMFKYIFKEELKIYPLIKPKKDILEKINNIIF
jgi:hypothetical protein